ncbi:hypothetical protein [Sorangium sp. So ce1335]|uniref:hypothetical protein n=1 Tax=Sorangium sp. So ce1335 TaxID=3133335 RepID=UPI003F638A97
MNPKRLALLSLVTLALCWSFLALSRETAAPRASVVPTLSWSELLSLKASTLAITTIGEGDVLVAGTFTDSLVIGGERLTARGASDIWVSRMDARGHHLWTKQFRAKGKLSSIEAGGDRLVLAGRSDSGVDFGGGALAAGVFLAKLDGSGNHVWSKVIAGAYSVPRVRVDGQGAVMALITTDGPIDLGTGPIASASSQIVAKLDPHGRHVWSKTYGPTVTVKDIAVTRDGEVIAGGRLSRSFDFGGGPVVEAGEGDTFLVRYDPDGRHRWSFRYGFEYASEDARKLTVDDAGNIFAAQLHNRAEDAFSLAKYDPYGNVLWTSVLGINPVQAMAADHAGNLAYSTDNEMTSDDVIGLLDGDGRPVSSRTLRFESSESGSIDGMAVTASGALLVVGKIYGPTERIDLWGPIVNPTRESTWFIAALALAPAPAPRE